MKKLLVYLLLLPPLGTACQDSLPSEHYSRAEYQSSPTSNFNIKNVEQIPLHIKSKSTVDNDFLYNTVNETPYYKEGPQQGRPQDGFFAKGTKLRLLKSVGSYSLVESENGVKAYVAGDDMKKI
jgi:hypothetical protein